MEIPDGQRRRVVYVNRLQYRRQRCHQEGEEEAEAAANWEPTWADYYTNASPISSPSRRYLEPYPQLLLSYASLKASVSQSAETYYYIA